jgi:hypothetical protein
MRDKSLSPAARILVCELEFAGCMAEQSCKFMLWQQALAGGKTSRAKHMAQIAIMELLQLDREFRAFWPQRNKGTPAKCSGFLRWRIADYRRALPALTPQGPRTTRRIPSTRRLQRSR